MRVTYASDSLHCLCRETTNAQSSLHTYHGASSALHQPAVTSSEKTTAVLRGWLADVARDIGRFLFVDAVVSSYLSKTFDLRNFRRLSAIAWYWCSAPESWVRSP